jgi:hypothetical protein
MTVEYADLASHHIEGYAAAVVNAGGGWAEAHFDVPLISHVAGNLWVGGCKGGVELHPDFKHVVSLYQWESYAVVKGTTYQAFEMYDGDKEPDRDEVDPIAEQVVKHLNDGQTLVHCQAGLNRSNLIAARTLNMLGWDIQGAINLLRIKRSELVLCNKTFELGLLKTYGEN